jgi:hypothetical protein
MIPKHDFESVTAAAGCDLRNQTDLLVHVQLAENLGRIQKMLVLVDPIFQKGLD